MSADLLYFVVRSEQNNALDWSTSPAARYPRGRPVEIRTGSAQSGSLLEWWYWGGLWAQSSTYGTRSISRRNADVAAVRVQYRCDFRPRLIVSQPRSL